MSDVTIDALTPGTPSSAASVPFSDAGVTLKVAPGLLLANAGNVGINTITPAATLDVNGDLKVSGNVGINTITPAATLDVNGDLKVSGNITGIPAWKLYIDTTASNRTSPVGFVKSYTETFYSKGGIHITNSGYSGGSTLMFEMSVDSNAVRTVTQFLKANDDRVSFFWNGFLQSTYGTAATKAAINWNLTVGNNLLQIILGDEGGGTQLLDLFGNIINPGVTFVS